MNLRLKARLHRLDHTVGRLGRRQVLFEFRTAMNLAVLRPMYDALASDPRIDCWLTTEERGAAARDACRRAGIDGRVISRERASWRRFDLYLNANPWCTVNLHRCRRRMTFFHGVAGKYDLDQPAGLPMGFECYDRVAFINEDRRRRYLAAGIVSPRQAALVGYPKVAALAQARYDPSAIRRAIGLDPRRPTVLYGPTYSGASSLSVAGEAIIDALLEADFNVILKLHERSLDRDPQHTGGVDWLNLLNRRDHWGRLVFPQEADASPYLAAADLVVTDHSSLGFEFLLLDRPLVVFDVPDLVREARINPEKVRLLRSAADVVDGIDALVPTVRRALAAPERRSPQRRQVAAAMFHDPGRATDRAVGIIYELLELPCDGRVAARLWSVRPESRRASWPTRAARPSVAKVADDGGWEGPAA